MHICEMVMLSVMIRSLLAVGAISPRTSEDDYQTGKHNQDVDPERCPRPENFVCNESKSAKAKQ